MATNDSPSTLEKIREALTELDSTGSFAEIEKETIRILVRFCESHGFDLLAGDRLSIPRSWMKGYRFEDFIPKLLQDRVMVYDGDHPLFIGRAAGLTPLPELGLDKIPLGSMRLDFVLPPPYRTRYPLGYTVVIWEDEIDKLLLTPYVENLPTKDPPEDT